MKRWIALAAVGSMLVVPVASGASWSQSGYDAGRTGAIPFEGPVTNDTAFQVQLPGVPTDDTVIFNGSAYVSTQLPWDDFEGELKGLNQTAIWRIDLTTGEVEKVLDLPDSAFPEVILPGLTIYQEGGYLVAADLVSGEERWRAQALADDETVRWRDYAAPVVVGDTLYIGFLFGRGVTTGESPAAQYGAYAPRAFFGVLKLDLETGEIPWEWEWDNERGQRIQRDVDRLSQDTEGTLKSTAEDPDRPHRFGGISTAADGQRVYAFIRVQADTPSVGVGYDRYSRQHQLRAIQEGQTLWTRNDTARQVEYARTPIGTQELDDSPDGSICCSPPVVTDNRLHVRLEAFRSYNKADGRQLWTSPAGQTDQINLHGATSMGARDGIFIGTSDRSVYRLDAVTSELAWIQSDPTPAKFYSTHPIALDEDTAYVPFLYDDCEEEGPGMEARDLATGELLWSWHYNGSVTRDACAFTVPNRPAFGPGVMVHAVKDGTVHVVGTTDASLGAPVLATDRYTGVDHQVRLDLSDTEPGAFGPATRYRVDWGDGTSTGWQADPVFTHTYANGTGTVEARLQVGNAANQTASTFVTMNVGQEAPAEPNWISERFAPENQDMTFGVLGILVAVTGGAIGVGRRYRKRSRLEQELDALETGFEETKDRPGQCEAFLETRKGRARSLVLDGDLTEEQGSMIEARADELRRELRTRALSDEFGFLPYSLVTKAREMLEDGRVTSLEAEAFLAALDEVDDLTDDQRTRVRERIKSWFARDTGGGASP